MWFLQSGLNLQDILMRILAVVTIVFLILPLHEFAHGWVAYKLGDKTAKYCGRLTLNPLAHFDPLGALSILLFSFGWARPVPIDPRNFEKPRRDMAITALAGPVSNLVAAIVGGLLLNFIIIIGMPILGSLIKWIYTFLMYYIMINVSLAVFNFIPIPPLDGFKIIQAFIPDKHLWIYYKYGNIITSAMFLLLLFGFFNKPLAIMQTAVYGAIVSITRIPFIFI